MSHVLRCTSCKCRAAARGRRTCEPCLERVRPTISIHKTLYENLFNFAKAHGVSMSSVVEYVIDRELGDVQVGSPIGDLVIEDAGGPLVTLVVSQHVADLVGHGGACDRADRLERAIHAALDREVVSSTSG